MDPGRLSDDAAARLARWVLEFPEPPHEMPSMGDKPFDRGVIAARVTFLLFAMVFLILWSGPLGGGCLSGSPGSGASLQAGWSGSDAATRYGLPAGVLDMPGRVPDVRAVLVMSSASFFAASAFGQGAKPQVLAWGWNSYGQCAVPAGLSDVIEVDGMTNTVALRSNGTVVAWGLNGDGQCNVPPSLRDVSAISAGNFHTLALRKDGSVTGWGRDNNQQVTGPSGVPSAIAVEACGYGSMVLRPDGTVQTWGGALYTPPEGLSSVTQIAGEDIHCAVRKADGTVVCWGSATYNGTWNFGQSTVPSDLTGVQKVATGVYHTLALRNDGSLVIWGRNSSGQRNVPPGNTFVDMDGGNDFSIGLTNQGRVLCWGSNGYQQLNVPTSAQVGVHRVAAGAHHGVALQGPPISIQTVRPISGSIAGGTAITILGSNFRPDSIVTVGGAPATNVVVVSSSMITANTPEGTIGPALVAVDFGTADVFYYSPVCAEDLDQDGEVGGSDISLLLLNFGDCPAP